MRQHASRPLGIISERRTVPAVAEQILVEASQPGLVRVGIPGPSQSRRFKSRLGLRIGHLGSIGMKCLELAPSSGSNRFNQLWVTERTEKLERMLFSIFFAHKQERKMRRKQEQACGQTLARTCNQRAESFAGGAVADLIMVLNADDETVAGKAGGGATVAAVTMCAIGAVEDERLLQELRKVCRSSIVFVVSLSLAGEPRYGCADRASVPPDQPSL
jgi:hypothetical protein